MRARDNGNITRSEPGEEPPRSGHGRSRPLAAPPQLPVGRDDHTAFAQLSGYPDDGVVPGPAAQDQGREITGIHQVKREVAGARRPGAALQDQGVVPVARPAGQRGDARVPAMAAVARAAASPALADSAEMNSHLKSVSHEKRLARAA